MEEKARGGDGLGQEEAGLGDGAAEGDLGQRGRRRRLQQTSRPELRRREDHTAAEETQTGLRAAAAHVGKRQLLILLLLLCPDPDPDPDSGLWTLQRFCSLTGGEHFTDSLGRRTDGTSL